MAADSEGTHPVTSSRISIRPVRSAADIRAFIDLPVRLYASDPNWVRPLDMDRRDHLDPKKNPYFDHAEVQLWLAWRGKECVGRISAQICRLHLERHGDNTGFFGFLEAVDEAEVFAALLAAAEDWLKARGMQRIRGPFNFSINEEMGLLVKGFDTPPAVMMTHALSYYAPRLEALGYSKAKDVFAYDMDKYELPPLARAVIKRARKEQLIEIRPINMADFDNELKIILDIFNQSWQDNWGFVPMTEAEITRMGKDLKMLIKGEYGRFAYVDGEPAAMIVSLPDVNDAIRDLDGRLFPLGLFKLLWRLKVSPIRRWRVPLMGIARKYHGKSFGAGLVLGMIEDLYNYHYPRGARWVELSWVLEDNKPMTSIARMLGSRPYKTYRIYERCLD